MKQFSEHFNKKATTTVKLRAAERRELKDRITAYMEYHPLPAELKSDKRLNKATPSPFVTEDFVTFSIPFAKIFKFSSVFAVFVLLIVPFMAERAVPGDALYAIKVHVNEEVRGSLTFDTYQKVEWETERLNRRIAEAKLLVSTGQLTEEVEAEVADAVRVHSANIQREIEVLRSEDADAATIAAISLDTTLEVQANTLNTKSKQANVADESSAEAALMAVSSTEVINLITNALNESRISTENSSTTVPAYNKLMAKIEQNTSRIYELKEALRVIISDEDLLEVNRRIEDAERALQFSIGLAETDELEARQKLVEVLQSTQRLIVYMTNIQVEQTVDIETIIPVVLTDEEKESMIADYNNNLANNLAEISSLLGKVEDENLVEKVVFAQSEISQLESLMSSSTDNFAAFKLLAEEAITLSSDALVLINDYLAPEIIIETTASSTATSTEDVVMGTEPASTTDNVVDETSTSTINTAGTTTTEVNASENSSTTIDVSGVTDEIKLEI